MAIEIKAPQKWPKGLFTIFMAGAIDQGKGEDWQKEFAAGMAGYDVLLLNPRRDDWDSSWEQSEDNPEFVEQVTWEQKGLEEADFRIFVLLDESEAPITLMEIGEHIDQPGMVCCEPEYYRKGNVDVVSKLNRMPVVESLEVLIAAVQQMLDEKGLAVETKKQSKLLTPKVDKKADIAGPVAATTTEESESYGASKAAILPVTAAAQWEGRDDYRGKEPRDLSTILQVPVDQIEAHEGVDDGKVEDLTEALRQGDSLPPIIVQRNLSGQGYTVVDGHHRFEAAKDLGYSEVPVRILGAKDRGITAATTNEDIVKQAKRIGPVYHGAAKWHDTIQNNQYRVGRFFSSSPDVAKKYGPKVFKAYITINKPFRVDAKGESYLEIRTPKAMRPTSYGDTVDVDNIAEFAWKNGYDGAIIKNVFEGNGVSITADDFVVFNQSQIEVVAEADVKKSAWGGAWFHDIGEWRDVSSGESKQALIQQSVTAATTPVPAPDSGFKPWYRNLPEGEQAPVAPPPPKERGVTETEAFKNWFAGSQVVDVEGKPLVAYHGSASPSKAFLSLGNSAFAQLGHWFDADPRTVHSYALGWDKAHQPNLLPVFLSIKSPKNYPDLEHLTDAANGRFGATLKARFLKLRKDLKKEGFDGAVVRNSVNSGNPDYWVAFDTQQIKSAIGNSGAFDAENKSITAGAKLCTCGHAWDEHYHLADFGCKHEPGCGCKGWSDGKTAKVAANPEYASPEYMAQQARFYSEQWAGEAKGYPYDSHPAHVPADSLHWVDEPSFDLHKIAEFDSPSAHWKLLVQHLWEMSLEERSQAEAKEYYDGFKQSVKDHTIEPIVVVQGTDLKFYLWDGNHRVAMAHVEGVTTMPAWVGYQPEAGKPTAQPIKESPEAAPAPVRTPTAGSKLLQKKDLVAK